MLFIVRWPGFVYNNLFQFGARIVNFDYLINTENLLHQRHEPSLSVARMSCPANPISTTKSCLPDQESFRQTATKPLPYAHPPSLCLKLYGALLVSSVWGRFLQIGCRTRRHKFLRLLFRSQFMCLVPAVPWKLHIWFLLNGWSNHSFLAISPQFPSSYKYPRRYEDDEYQCKATAHGRAGFRAGR